MTEARELISSREIPKNWIFPERGNQNIQVIGCNPQERSLSGRLKVLGEEFDYLFDPSGLPVSARHFGNPNKDPIIILWAEDSIRWYKSLRENSLGVPQNRESPRLTVGISNLLGKEEVKRADRFEFRSRGELGRVLISQIFSKEKPIAGPPIAVIPRESGFQAKDWHLVFYKQDTDFVLVEEGNPNRAIFRDSAGEEFMIEVQVGKENGSDSGVSNLKIIETHLGDNADVQDVKVLQAPLSIKNIQRVERTLFSRQSGEEASWRDVDQLIGVRVYYTRQQKA